MKTRKEISDLIEEKIKLQKSLKLEIIELQKEACLLSDKEQWFTERTEECIVSRRPKKTEKVLIGRIHWKENFKDDDTDDVITIERSMVVRKNGEWI